jgi:hypothetical protein
VALTKKWGNLMDKKVPNEKEHGPGKGESPKSNNTKSEPKWIRNIILFMAFILIIVFIHSESSKQIRHATETKWIAKCEESKENDKLYRIAKVKQDFQKVLSDSITKLQSKLDKQLADRIASEIITSSEVNRLDPILITALICVESRFDVLAHGSKGEVGLMQVRYKVWKEDPILQDNGVDAKSKLYWIDLNIGCGTKIFAKYYEESEYDVIKTLYRYNSGSKELPENRKFYEIDYANRVILTAYKIRESIRKDKEVTVIE